MENKVISKKIGRKDISFFIYLNMAIKCTVFSFLYLSCIFTLLIDIQYWHRYLFAVHSERTEGKADYESIAYRNRDRAGIVRKPN